jgi:hypothetical protein
VQISPCGRVFFMPGGASKRTKYDEANCPCPLG